MKRLLLPALVILTIFMLHGISLGQAKPREGAVLVDTRTPSEYNAERAKGARLLPHDLVRERAATVLPDKSVAIDLYCRSGRRAGIALDALKGMGYTNVVNVGSIEDLKKSGVEVESGAIVPER